MTDEDTKAVLFDELKERLHMQTEYPQDAENNRRIQILEEALKD